jgi:hypothetical protein
MAMTMLAIGRKVLEGLVAYALIVGVVLMLSPRKPPAEPKDDPEAWPPAPKRSDSNKEL